MARWTLLLGVGLLVASCSKGEDATRSAKPGAAAPSVLVLKVDGMQRGEGGKT